MKTSKLKEILGNEELDLEEKASQIMALNGQDVNAAKESSNARVQELESENATLKAKNTELTSQAEKYADYDDLAKFKADTLSEKENNQKKAYLESLGFKRPDLFMDKIDWSNAKYDDGTKQYTGLDIEGLKTAYADLYNEPAHGSGTTEITFGALGDGKGNSQSNFNQDFRNAFGIK